MYRPIRLLRLLASTARKGPLLNPLVMRTTRTFAPLRSLSTTPRSLSTTPRSNVKFTVIDHNDPTDPVQQVDNVIAVAEGEMSDESIVGSSSGMRENHETC